MQCPTETQKTLWMTTYASLGSGVLILAVFIAMIYFGLWRYHSWHKFAHLGSISFVMTIFMKGLGLCGASIFLRIEGNWRKWSWSLLNAPDQLLTIAFTFVYCAWANFSLKNVAYLVNRLTNISISIGVCLGLTGLSVTIAEIVSGNVVYRDIDVILSVVRDFVMGILFLILLTKVRKVKNVKLCNKEKNNTERSLHILTIVSVVSIMLRGFTIAAYHWAFSPDKNPQSDAECSVSHLLSVIIQQIVCNIVPILCLTIMQGLVGKVAEYDMIHPQ